MISSTLNFNSGPSVFEATISTNQQELNLATWATGQGWDGTAAATITVGSGVYIWSDNIATPALTTGSFPGGLTLIVEGFIMGKGGDGGGQIAAIAGGPAISFGCDVTITGGASAYVGGGGGGGGGVATYSGGGGAGGGDAGTATSSAPGLGGAVGEIGTNGINGTDEPAGEGSSYDGGFGGGSGGGGAGSQS